MQDVEGVGYARSSEDIRKGKSGKSEGALLKQEFQLDTDRPIEEWQVINSKPEHSLY